MPITKGDDGKYYAEIPESGEIYLNATLEKEEPFIIFFDWAEGPYVGSGSTEKAIVTFNLDGGKTARGEEGPIVKEVPVGTWLRLLDAPVKDGAKFERWQCSDESVTVTEPGKSFKVEGSVSFEAIWADAA